MFYMCMNLETSSLFAWTNMWLKWLLYFRVLRTGKVLKLHEVSFACCYSSLSAWESAGYHPLITGFLIGCGWLLSVHTSGSEWSWITHTHKEERWQQQLIYLHVQDSMKQPENPAEKYVECLCLRASPKGIIPSIVLKTTQISIKFTNLNSSQWHFLCI